MVAGIAIEPYTTGHEDAVVTLLARAFATNPIHVAAFGDHAMARNDVFFRVGVALLRGPKIVAVERDRVVGFNHWVDYPGCIVAPRDRMRVTPVLMKGLGLRAARRTVQWVGAWADSHPSIPHVHLGPLGVEPAEQGRGIGTLLMERHIEDLDRRRVPGYLETDRPGNVVFYERFGFRLVREVGALGVTNFFMWRAAS